MEEKQEIENLIFNPGVGARIPTSTGLRWIEQYKHQLATGRNEQAYVVTKPNLESVMQSTSDLIGVTLHHALDYTGAHHIIIIPIDNSLRLWNSDSQRIFLDANTDSELNITVAREWIDNYEVANPDAVRYHFFGANIFEEVVLSPEFQIMEAINDEQVPQLLLVVQPDLATGGRSATIQDIYDMSTLCPKQCLEDF